MFDPTRIICFIGSFSLSDILRTSSISLSEIIIIHVDVKIVIHSSVALQACYYHQQQIYALSSSIWGSCIAIDHGPIVQCGSAI